MSESSSSAGPERGGGRREASISIEDYPRVSTRLRELGFEVLGGLLILPTGFEDATAPAEMCHVSDASTIQKLWTEAGIQGEVVQPKEGPKVPTLIQHGFSWIAPTIFVSSMLLTENPSVVAVALNIVGNYATDFFRGRLGRPEVRLRVVTEDTNGNCTELSYEGPPEGVRDLRKSIEQIARK